MSITDDEKTVLMIADRGEYMVAIGRWELPIRSLFSKGLLVLHQINGGAQYTISDAGRAELDAADSAEDANLGKLIEQGKKIGAAQKSARECAEAAAQELADCAKASSPITGDTPEAAARKWSPIVLNRALDIINNG
jgi:hypothetical protein